MPIKFTCGSCQQLIQVPDGSGGKQGRCPHCSTIMEIPLSSSSPTVGNPPQSTSSSAPPKPAAAPQGSPYQQPQMPPAPDPYGWSGGAAPQPFASQPAPHPYPAPQPMHTPGYGGQMMSHRSKLTAGLLGILLGGWGVHRFYLGDIGTGVAQIFVTILTCGIGGIWGFVEGIMILTGSMDRDAEGRLLQD